jgi:type IV pilus assembly protein PilQ
MIPDTMPPIDGMTRVSTSLGSHGVAHQGLVPRLRREGWLPALAMVTLLAGTDAAGLKAAAQSVSPASPSPTGQRRVRVVNGGAVELKVRRLPEGVDLVIEGVGAAPQLQQTTRGSTWEGRLLTSGATTLRLGPQRLSLPEAGLQSISIDGGGTQYRLMVTPTPGFPLARPLVSADGRNLILSFNAPAQTSLQTLSPNLTTPGRVSQPTYVPPLQPRAVAPPVGDMAVGSMMIRNNSFVQISGPRVTLTMRDAPAKAALMALARIGGYGFAFLDEKEPDKSTFLTVGTGSSRESKSELVQGAGARPVNLSFVNESYQTALNSALLSAGLQAKLEGNILFVGISANSK